VKKNSKLTVVSSLIALVVPIVTLSAQGGRGGPPVPRNNPPPTSPVSGDPVNGKALFYAYSCYACHGYNGETGARPFVVRLASRCAINMPALAARSWSAP
jgi:cytochrome c